MAVERDEVVGADRGVTAGAAEDLGEVGEPLGVRAQERVVTIGRSAPAVGKVLAFGSGQGRRCRLGHRKRRTSRSFFSVYGGYARSGSGRVDFFSTGFQ